MVSPANQNYQEREKRILDAIALKEPDRIPIIPLFSFFNCYFSGISPKEAFSKPQKALEAWRKTILHFEPDATYNVNSAISAPDDVLTKLDFKAMKWPGHGVADDQSFQFIEAEYLKADEIDAFLLNPGDFFLKQMLPRLAGNLLGLQKMPSMETVALGYQWPAVLPLFSDPDVVMALETLIEAAKMQTEWAKTFKAFAQELKDAGFPSMKEQTVFAPYDIVGDNMRGTKGSAKDLLVRPDKLKAVVERMTPFVTNSAIQGARSKGNPRVFIPLHKGTDSFMSLSQFKSHYWPSLQKLIVDLVEAGCTPYLLIEGAYNTRLEIIKEVPKGKCIYHFEATDIFKAKKVLGDTVCIMGNLPCSLLATGSTKQVAEYTKKLINECGVGGGFIMSAGALIDHAKIENVEAWFETTRLNGNY